MRTIKNKRSISFILLIFLVFTCFSIPTYASTENEGIKEQENIELTDTVAVDEISENEIMTFPEMIAHYANSKGISYAEAINGLPDDIK